MSEGDLFYLLVRTLEGAEIHITAWQGGFFVNMSNGKQFDPQANPQYSCNHSLIDLLREISPLFKKELAALQDAKELVPSPVSLLTALRYNHQWLTNRPEPQEVQWDPMRTESWALNLHGLDITSVRDWNEELQVRVVFVEK